MYRNIGVLKVVVTLLFNMFRYKPTPLSLNVIGIYIHECMIVNEMNDGHYISFFFYINF